MKLSRVMHVVSGIVSILGFLALLAAWTAGSDGQVFGVSQAHLYSDAIVIELIAIAAAVCTLVRLQLEALYPGRSPLV